MDIKIPDSLLRQYLNTDATPEKIAQALTLCGPSVDRLTKTETDTVYEIEAITNRVDTASAFGIAREANAILPLFGIKATLINNPYQTKASDLPQKGSTTLPLEVEIKDENLVSRFAAIVLDNLTMSVTPEEMRHQLEDAGIRSLNNLVDITNYLTLCYGQPVHIFDYDKIKGAKMILRESEKGETITTLDGKTHKLLGGDIVIEDGEGRLIDLCGIMGAKNSEVDENTKRAILFVQTYHPKKIRKTSLYTQERTLAAQIFEKSPDSRLVAPVLIGGVKLLMKHAGGKIASVSTDLYYKKPVEKTVSLNLKWLNLLTGHKFALAEVTNILTDLGFIVKKKTPDIEVLVPSWREADINISEDLAEEVARVYGYFRLESILPESKYVKTETEPLLEWEYQVKAYLAHLGFSEIFNYSLVSQDLFTKANMGINPSVRLKNPLASEFEYMRRSLIPSLLANLSQNQGRVEPPLRIFELANVYLLADSADLPEERPMLAFATTSLPFRISKGYLEALLTNLGLSQIAYKKIDDEDRGPLAPNQTAEVYSNGHFLGVFGGLRPLVRENFGLDSDTFITNLDFRTIADLATRIHSYHPVSNFPDIIEDVTIKSDKSVGELIQLIKEENPLIISVAYLSSHENKHSFRIHFNNPKSNLTQEEVGQIRDSVLHLG